MFEFVRRFIESRRRRKRVRRVESCLKGVEDVDELIRKLSEL